MLLLSNISLEVYLNNKKEEFNMSKIKSFFMDESGQAMTEYGLIIALVAIAVIAALTVLGTTLASKFTTINANITN